MIDTPLSRAVARVEATTLVIGSAAAIYEFAVAGWRAALAIAIGTLISWLNYRWLRSGVAGMVPAPVPASSPNPSPEAGVNSAQAPPPPAHSSGKIFAMFIARITLLLAALYVILSRSLLPSTPLLAGLFASVAAVILQMVFLLLSGGVGKTG
jgi:hypothetical protein